MVCVLGMGDVLFVLEGGGVGFYLLLLFVVVCFCLFVCFSSYGSFSVLPHR